MNISEPLNLERKTITGRGEPLNVNAAEEEETSYTERVNIMKPKQEKNLKKQGFIRLGRRPQRAVRREDTAQWDMEHLRGQLLL